MDCSLGQICDSLCPMVPTLWVAAPSPAAWTVPTSSRACGSVAKRAPWHHPLGVYWKHHVYDFSELQKPNRVRWQNYSEFCLCFLYPMRLFLLWADVSIVSIGFPTAACPGLGVLRMRCLHKGLQSSALGRESQSQKLRNLRWLRVFLMVFCLLICTSSFLGWGYLGTYSLDAFVFWHFTGMQVVVLNL